MENYTLVIEGDENDADFMTQLTNIDSEKLELVKKVVEAIKANPDKHNWENAWEDYKDKLTKEEYEAFNEMVPWTEFGIHTITAIKITPQITWENLLLGEYHGSMG